MLAFLLDLISIYGLPRLRAMRAERGRSGRNRTSTRGFGDPRSTINLRT